MAALLNSFDSLDQITVDGQSYAFCSLKRFEKNTGKSVSSLPFSLRVLLENLLRREDGITVTREDILAVADWDPKAEPTQEIQFMPSRILLQDFTGVPAVADLAAMRGAMKRLGGDPSRINPLQPADLVIDHSVQVDEFGSSAAFQHNADLEFSRNRERYEFLKWGQSALKNFRVVPPDTGIVHQVNLEYLAQVAFTTAVDGKKWVYPDSLVGTDSHTTMINGLGVVGWGVGGIEAEAAMLGQPCVMLIPQVVGFELTGKLPRGTTATDLVLTVTQMLRKKGVVGKFVEFFGPGLESLVLEDRATLANMAPEYGATIGIFPVDRQTTDYLVKTHRGPVVPLVETYYKAQGMWADGAQAASRYTDTLRLDLATIEPTLAGPARPQDRVPLSQAPASFATSLGDAPKDKKIRVLNPNGLEYELGQGSVVIAAITSCTNTSNPYGLITAGLLAKHAVERGLQVKPWVKTSLAPGSLVVTDYLNAAGLTPHLQALRFHLVGYGCTTCIGNSGPLPIEVSKAITEGELSVASVLSGNRNFEGRVHPQVRANYLASPALVVAYALAGTMNVDLTKEPIAHDPSGHPVFLKDIWPTQEEIDSLVKEHVTAALFKKSYADVFRGDEKWQSLKIPQSELYKWDEKSTYIKEPPFFGEITKEPKPITDIANARALAVLKDSITTDHISPAGDISKTSAAAAYLAEQGVKPSDFNSYGARRGNHEVMMRGTFANIRLKNQMVPGVEGGVTVHLPSNRQMSIFDAAMVYKSEKTPLVILAGKEYGSGSSRDWAAKGPMLQGVRVAIAESFERIHRSNLVGMGVLPLQFLPGESVTTLGLTGKEFFSFSGLTGLTPKGKLTVQVKDESGKSRSFEALIRIDTPNELEYYKHGGILPYVLRSMVNNG